MPETTGIPKELAARIAAVTNKRARFVLDAIAREGLVTTEQISGAGYEHPPRAARDARELGFRLRTIKVKHTTNGRTIAAYVFDEGELDASKVGRRLLPKRQRDVIIHAAGDKCHTCGADHNLQVDHRIPYDVVGEPSPNEEQPYQVLCGSCNRKKAWDCEHCQNCLEKKRPGICRSCYWADPTAYTHVAMRQQRRADVVWAGSEVKDFERLSRDAKRNKKSVPDQIKTMLRSR